MKRIERSKQFQDEKRDEENNDKRIKMNEKKKVVPVKPLAQAQ